jgi:hypothetical protein
MIRLTCREVIARLADYVEAALGLLMRARIRMHLWTCAPCRAYLATYRRTVALTSRAGQAELSGDARDRVTRDLLERLRRGD